MRSILWLSALALGVTLGAAEAARAAGDRVDVSRGHELARSWCWKCHAVDPGDPYSLVPDAPAFQALADQPSTTELSLRAFLRTPHPSMPNFRIEPRDLDDLVAYILSLRER